MLARLLDRIGTLEGQRIPATFWVVWSGTLFNRLGTMVEPFLILFLTQYRQLSIGQAGVVAASLGAGAIIGPAVGGHLADHWGRRKTLVTSMVGTGVGFAALGLASSLVALIAAALIAGVLIDMFRPASAALIADIVPVGARTYAYSLNYWAINAGTAVAGVLAAVLVSHGWWWLFVIDALTCLGFAAIVWIGIPTDPPRARPVMQAHGPTPGYATAVRDGFLVIFGLTIIAEALIYLQAWFTYPLVMVDAGLPAASFGFVATVNGVMIIVLQPWWARRIHKFNAMNVSTIGLVVIGVGFWLTQLATTLTHFLLATAFWTIGEIIRAGLVNSVVSHIAPPSARGRYLGLISMCFGIAAMLAPVIGTQVFERAGANALWNGALVLSLIACIALQLLKPHWNHRVSQGVHAEGSPS